MTLTELLTSLLEELPERTNWATVVLRRSEEEGIEANQIFELSADDEARELSLITDQDAPAPWPDEEALSVGELAEALRELESRCGNYPVLSASAFVPAEGEQEPPREVPIVGVAQNDDSAAIALLQAPLEQWGDLFD